MTGDHARDRWRTDGKFFRAAGRRVSLRAVTYGPFPGGWPRDFAPDFQRIRAAGFNALRLFEMPGRGLLDVAAAHGLQVFGGLHWGQNEEFFRTPRLLSAARVLLAESLRETAGHRALAGVFVANEIPADLVRWMGPARVRATLEELIDLGRESAPRLLFAYANYPSTEYLEPENADFTAFNIYLEQAVEFRAYVKRLHHIAGDRPLVVSEFGLDSGRNGLVRQAETLRWAEAIAAEEECAGFTIFSWSDRWWNNSAEVGDWDFGLIDRDGNDKPAIEAVTAPVPAKVVPFPRFSVIVCTRNGRERIDRCLVAIRAMDGDFETVLVDDGSTDGTSAHVARHHPWVKLVTLDPCGLSAARNAGADAATGDVLAYTDDDCEPDREWLVRLVRVLADGRFSAAGGPNLPPPPRDWHEAVVCASPGAPSHVMLDDEEAEHLPGCNLAVTRAAFDAIGGFDTRFETAGDDVDFCWRLREAGFRLGFAPGAFVWHHRRKSVRGFLRQQIGYGRAERLLLAKHPSRFSKRGGARWHGFVYGGGPVRAMDHSLIEHGPMGRGGYQSIRNRMLPLRGIDTRFSRWWSRAALALVEFLVPHIRAWERNRTLIPPCEPRSRRAVDPAEDEIAVHGIDRDLLLDKLLAAGWKPGGPFDPWDARRGNTRVLVATEHHADGSKDCLVRVWGDPADLRQSIRDA